MMVSKIKEAIGLKSQPVAVLKMDHVPGGLWSSRRAAMAVLSLCWQRRPKAAWPLWSGLLWAALAEGVVSALRSWEENLLPRALGRE